MTDRRKPIARARTFWESLRQDGGLPRRADIDPRALPGILTNTFLIERVAPGITRFRIAGALLSDLMGMDVRGMPFLSIVEPAERSRLTARLEQMFDEPATLDLTLRGEGTTMGARILLLPVESLRGVDMALGCIETDGVVLRPPLRLRPVRVLQERILAQGTQPMQAGFAEDAAPFAHRPTKPAIRLVYSRDQNISEKDTPSE